MRTRLTLPIYLLASGASLLGNAAIMVVLPWLVLERTGDPAIAGLVAALSAVPSAIAAFVGGHLIDRLGRRLICVISDVGSALSVAALAVVDAAVGLDVGWFIALGIAGAIFDVPGQTARQTLMADVSRTSGVSLDRVAASQSSLFGMSMLVGPAVAGALLAVLPSIDVVWLTAATSAFAALAIAVMPLESRGERETAETPDDSILAGWRIVRRSSPLIALIVIELASMILVAPLLSIILPAHFVGLARPELLGLSLSAYAVGMLIGSAIYGAVMGQRRWVSWVVANIAFALCFALIAPLWGFWLVALGMAVAGVGAGLMQPVHLVVMTEQIPEAYRGRVFALFSGLSMVASPIGLGLMSMLLAGADLRWGAIALAVGWVPAMVYAIAAPGLAAYIRGSRREMLDAHH